MVVILGPNYLHLKGQIAAQAPALGSWLLGEGACHFGNSANFQTSRRVKSN